MSESEFSRRIRDLRAKHGLTLDQVAQCVGVGKSTVRKWETGMIENMRRDKIAKLAAALHTTRCRMSPMICNQTFLRSMKSRNCW